MTVTTEVPRIEAAAVEAAAVEAAEIEVRGTLDIAPLVLRKIVEHAADQVPGTLRHGRRLAGIDVGESGATAKITTGSGDPDAVDVRLDLTLQYPAAVRDVVAAVRAHVGDELARIAGRRMRALTVTVSGLRAAPAAVSPRIR